MNHWLAEELTWLACAERQRALEALRLQTDFSVLRANRTVVARVALQLSDWLITTGESLRKRYEETAPVSPWVSNRRFAR